MADNNKNTQEKYIQKPFLRGKAIDETLLKSSASIFGGLLLLMLAFLLLGMLMMFDQRVLAIAINTVLLIGCYMVFYANGVNRGATAVNQGEILYHRQQTNREYRQNELDCCYHPAKGFIIGLIGTAPVFVLAVIFALITERQMTTMGALPSWVTNLSGHSEITDALDYYMASASFGFIDFLRIFVRMNIMPFVNIFDSTNLDAMFLLERIAPALVLIPGLSYGIGYTQGARARARVHGEIALGKRKQAKKAKREKKRQQMKLKEPTRLN